MTSRAREMIKANGCANEKERTRDESEYHRAREAPSLAPPPVMEARRVSKRERESVYVS